MFSFDKAMSRTHVLKLTQKQENQSYCLAANWAHAGLMSALKAVITSAIYFNIDKTKYYIKHKKFKSEEF